MGSSAVNVFIGGRTEAAAAFSFQEVWDPATGEVMARTPLCGGEDVAKAVEAARAAFPDWADTPVPRRARVMFRLQGLIERHLDELAELVTKENGKVFGEARGEVMRGLEVVEFAAGMPTLMMGRGLEQVSAGVDTDMYRYPVGVVGGITPFNFPVMIPLWMAPIAIAAGNTFVLKPSPRTPLSAMRLAELFAEAGVPDGVFNVIHGAAETSNALIDHPHVAAISFVGSAAAAKAVYARSAAAGKRVQALAGAKNHMIIMPDADPDAVTEAVFSSAFGNAGERCLAGSVAMPLGGAADIVIERLAERASRARLGHGLDEDTDVTALTTAAHRQRVADWIQRGLDEGAELVVDGRGRGPEGGFFLGPTILDRVEPHMGVAREEIFGPVLSVTRMEDLDGAIDIINRSEYGNAAVIFTRDGMAARRFRRRVDAGMIGVNVGVPAPMAFFPFTGWKGSFYGDLHATGQDAVDFYTRRKVITTRWF